MSLQLLLFFFFFFLQQTCLSLHIKWLQNLGIHIFQTNVTLIFTPFLFLCFWFPPTPELILCNANMKMNNGVP